MTRARAWRCATDQTIHMPDMKMKLLSTTGSLPGNSSYKLQPKKKPAPRYVTSVNRSLHDVNSDDIQQNALQVTLPNNGNAKTFLLNPFPPEVITVWPDVKHSIGPCTLHEHVSASAKRCWRSLTLSVSTPYRQISRAIKFVLRQNKVSELTGNEWAWGNSWNTRAPPTHSHVNAQRNYHTRRQIRQIGYTSIWITGTRLLSYNFL